ncbi:sensor histidine kinase [Streptococcus porcinus]|uniref:sensor histidine kinase n=1 Tax=Streptococcus porcinus TaxID=1340 RepID=UPI001960FF1B|nr:HAMP domain-containing sensor histidine kinase [Streptococcus porcinus]
MAKAKQLQWSLRSYFVVLFIGILFVTCLSGLLVVYALRTGLQLEGHLLFWITIYTGVILILGSFIMWQGSIHLTRPIQDLNQAVKAVAQGNFDYQIVRKTYPKDTAPYHNEIDQLSQNVNQMAQDLKNLAQLRQDFISNVSHELKTPVASLVGLSDLLADSDLNREDQAELLALMQSETLRLSRLCDDILNLSRLDRQDQLRIEKVRVDEQIRHSLILLKEKWKDKEIQIDFQALPLVWGTDPDLSMQIWLNLLDNAIKYSGIQVNLTIIMKADHKGLSLTFQDKGIGIAPDKLRYIFDQFYQVDQSHSQEGNGLGLAIVKRIVTLLKGQLEVFSQEGEGTQVILFLPKLVD